jgi:hypothetical protein
MVSNISSYSYAFNNYPSFELVRTANIGEEMRLGTVVVVIGTIPTLSVSRASFLVIEFPTGSMV